MTALPQFLPTHYGDLARAVLDHVAAHPWSTSREVAAALDTTPQNVTHALTRLRATGMQRAGEGQVGNPYVYALQGVPRVALAEEPAAVDLREPLIREIVEAHRALDAAGVSRTHEGRVATLAERIGGATTGGLSGAYGEAGGNWR